MDGGGDDVKKNKRVTNMAGSGGWEGPGVMPGPVARMERSAIRDCAIHMPCHDETAINANADMREANA
jgi:hypothetical protein